MQDNDRYQVLSTKVSNDAYILLRRLAKKKGFTIYELAQMVFDTFIRYMDDSHNLTAEIEKAMNIFYNDMKIWDEAFNLADPTVQKEVGQAVYIMQDPEGVHKGIRACMVSKPFFDNPRCTYNVQTILERMVEACMPKTYIKLRRMAVDMECASLLELFETLIVRHEQEDDEKEIRQMFEDCQRHEYGKPIEYGQRTRRKKHHNVDEMPGLFDHEEYEGGTIDDLPWAGSRDEDKNEEYN